MIFDDAQPHPSMFDSPDSELRLGRMLAELLHDWFEVMSHVAYETHRACEFFAQNGGPARGQYGSFAARARHRPSEEPNRSIDMDKLKECLRSMDPEQAVQIMHAVQAMQTMEAMLKKYRSQTNDSEQAPW
jgi:hypothetical protein